VGLFIKGEYAVRAVVQRVSQGKVAIGDEVVGEIERGLVLLLGVEKEDEESDLEYMVEKVINLRVFPDEEEKMNLSLQDVQGDMLVVSQFTLLGDCRKGRRPSFFTAAPPEKAEEFYDRFVKKIKERGINVATGEFQAMMEVQIFNDGPVTLLIDSKKSF